VKIKKIKYILSTIEASFKKDIRLNGEINFSVDLKIGLENGMGELAEAIRKILLTKEASSNLFSSLKLIHKEGREELKQLNKYLSNHHFSSSHTFEILNRLSLEEILSLYNEYKRENKNKRILFLLEIFILKKERIAWLKSFLKIIKSIIISFGELVLNFKRDFRFFYRRITSIHFKNLDDYHSLSVL
jgi:hypothetical protein